MKPTDQKIEQVATASLVPYAKNAKKHDAAQVAAIAGSIREFGFNNPVLIDGDNGIIAGHGRVLAAHQLGLDAVPCLRLTHLTDTQKRAYILADNRLAELGGGWDAEMLAAELESLSAEGITMEEIGFDADALEELGAGLDDEGNPEADAEPQIDKAEELRAKWGVEPGQLWEIGDHRILCGDSTKKEDVDRVMRGEKAVCCITDPPYSVNYDTYYQRKFNKEPRSIDKAYTEGESKDDATDILKFMALVPAPVMVWSYPIDRHFQTLADAYRTNRWSLKKELVWVKDSFSFWAGAKYQQKHEPIMLATKEGASIGGDVPSNATTVFEFARPRTHELHPTAKPIELWSVFVKNHAKQGDCIYEPFSGSGTTIIACEQLGRKCRAIEISPAYVAVALQRWADATGKTPKLVA
jgi:DNA modification methylase